MIDLLKNFIEMNAENLNFKHLNNIFGTRPLKQLE